MPRSAAVHEPRAGTVDMLSARSSAVRKRLGNVDKISVEYIEACGDCFYLAIEGALCEEEGVAWCPFYAVSAQREVVATSLNEEIFRLYAMLHEEKADGVLHVCLACLPRSCMCNVCNCGRWTMVWMMPALDVPSRMSMTISHSAQPDASGPFCHHARLQLYGRG